MWFYPKNGSTQIDRVVTYNYAENVWTTGSLARTTYVDAYVFDNPYATEFSSTGTPTFPTIQGVTNQNGASTYYAHEIGNNQVDSTGAKTAIPAFIQSGEFDLSQDGDGQFEIWANNQEIANFNTSSITFTKDLSVAQNIVHTGDTDTKIEFITDSLSFHTADSERFRITSTGRIEQSNNNEDIDMDSSANGQLKLDGDGYNVGFALNATGLQIYTNSANRGIIFGINETERCRITNNGRF